MKKHNIALTASLAILMSACNNFQIPESVSIKSEAKFQVPLGTASYDVSSVISSESIRETLQNALADIGGTVYDYISEENSDVLNYLIKMNLMDEFSLPNMKEMMNSFDPSSFMPSFNSDFSFTAPKIEANIDTPIVLPDFADVLKGSKTPEIESPQFPECDSSSLSIQGTSILSEINVRGGSESVTYDRIWYQTGKLRLTFRESTGTPYSSGYAINLKVKILDGDTVLGESPLQDITQNPNLDIPLTHANGIPQEFKLKFEGTTSGGNLSVKHKIKAAGEFIDIMPGKLTGVNATAEALGVDENVLAMTRTIPLDGMIPDGIKSIKFSTAEINLDVKSPSGWTGIELSLSEPDSFVIEGVTNSTLTPQSQDTTGSLLKKKYIWGAELNAVTTQSLSLKIKPKLSVHNATIVLEGGATSISVDTHMDMSLSTLDEAIVDLAAMGAPSFSLPTDGSSGSVELPEALTKFVKQITFNETVTNADGSSSSTARKGLGFKCKITNTLPAGNDIGLELQGFKKIDAPGYYFDKDVELTAGSNAQEVTWVAYPTVKFPEPENDADGNPVKQYLAFNVNFKDADNFKITNLVLDREYQLKIEDFEPCFDWDSISLDLSSFSRHGEQPLDFNLSTMMAGLPIGEDDISQLNNLGVRTLPLYIYAEKSADSSFLDQVDLAGNAYMSFTKGDSEIKHYIDILDESGESSLIQPILPKDFKVVSPVSWPTETTITGKSSDPTNIAYYLTEEKSTACGELKGLFSNLDANDITLCYEFGPKPGTPTTIWASSLENSGEEKMAVTVALLLSFDFELKAPIAMNIMTYVKDYDTPNENGQYSDLFDRQDASSFAEYAGYAESIEYVGIDYNVNNKLIKNIGLAAKLEDNKGDTGVSANMDFSSGHHLQKFTKDQITAVMTKYPFHPDIFIQLGRDLTDSEKGASKYLAPENFYFSREGANSSDSLSARVIVAVQMDGDTPITVWKKDN